MSDSRPGLAESTDRDAFIAGLHADGPAYRDPGGYWLLGGFEAVRAVLLDPANFSSSPNVGSLSIPLISDDPPRHGVMRGLLAKAFTPAAIEAMRPAIEAMATRLVAALPDGQEIDIVGALTTPLPVEVISAMMGVPHERADDFKRWSNAALGIAENVTPEVRMSLMAEMMAFFREHAARRRAQPGGDLVSALTRVRETNETLSDEQIVGYCILLLVAGNETTTNLLSNLLDHLSRTPGDWAACRADPAQIDRAIEESLRVDSPIQMVARRTCAPVSVGGVEIPEGEMVLAYLAGANRDPNRWREPATFALDRQRERHLAFGHGVHTCIGAPLARLEAKAAISALLARFGTLSRGVAPAVRLPGGMMFGFRTLPVTLRTGSGGATPVG